MKHWFHPFGPGGSVRRVIGPLAVTRPFRLGVAVALVAAHFLVASYAARTNSGLPFNAAPGHAPFFAHPATDGPALFWDWLATSRWDSVHYIGLALRGYGTCPPGPITDFTSHSLVACQLSFYPAYALIGRVLSTVTGLAIDWAMLGCSLVASVGFLYLWTHEVMRRALGTRGCYLSLLAFNAFPAAFALVTLQTEPLVFVATLGCVIALERRKPTFAAILAGFVAGMRVTGVATSVAYVAALAVVRWRDLQKPTPRLLLATAAQGLLSGWGLLAMMLYHWHRFGDPLTYVHSHSATFGHEPSLGPIFHPAREVMLHAMELPEHEGVWLAGAFLWLGLGMRSGLSGFSTPIRAFWWALTVVTFAVAMLGTASLGYTGMIRYMLLIFPLFFAIVAATRRSTMALPFWIVLSAWSYFHVSLRVYMERSPYLTNWALAAQSLETVAPGGSGE